MSDTHADLPFKAPKISACPKQWEDMAGDDKKRYCEHCTLHVHDLSAMPRKQAEAMLANRTDRLCVTYLADAEGNLLSVEELKAAGYTGLDAGAPIPPAVPALATASSATRASGPEPRGITPTARRWNIPAMLASLAAGFASLGCINVAPVVAAEMAGFATPPPVAVKAKGGKDSDAPADPPPQPTPPPDKEPRVLGKICPRVPGMMPPPQVPPPSQKKAK